MSRYVVNVILVFSLCLSPPTSKRNVCLGNCCCFHKLFGKIWHLLLDRWGAVGTAWLETAPMKTARLNQNSNILGRPTKTMSYKMLKCVEELRGVSAAFGHALNSADPSHFLWRRWIFSIRTPKYLVGRNVCTQLGILRWIHLEQLWGFDDASDMR